MDYFISYFSFEKGFLYYTLGNLDPKLRSSLKSIYLLSVVKHEYIIKYGIDEMLKPVVQDILKLEKVQDYFCLYHKI